MADKPIILLAAGGTGGHIFPAQALAQAAAKQGYQPVLITDTRYANYASQYDDWQVHTICSSSSGSGLLRKAHAALQIGKGYFQARKLLRDIKPAVAVGFGGYPSFPTMVAAHRMNIPTIIHEQNSLLGQANHMLAPNVNKIATSFAEVAGVRAADMGKVNFTGNPVRAAIRAARHINFPSLSDHCTLHVLVMGGSQGAAVFGDVVPAALELLEPALRKRIRVDHQCRPEQLDAVRAHYEKIDVNADLATFFDDVPARLTSAHLVITRSGASTIAELSVAGRPAIFVPYPYAKDDHQTMNANMLEERGGAWVMPQDVFTPEALATRLQNLLTLPSTLFKAAIAMRKLGTEDADLRLLKLAEELMKLSE